MNRVVSRAVIVAGLVLTLSGAVSWGQVPPTNDKSDTHANTGGGTGALGSPMLSGADNTAYGYFALRSNTTGNNNTASGFEALRNNTTGGANTAAGLQALHSNTTGFDNTAAGVQALYNNTKGFDNTASGVSALFANTTGFDNTAAGSYALEFNTTGASNTAAGVEALRSNTTGAFNTATGASALSSNTTGHHNTASGYQALSSNTGSSNTASGAFALSSTTTGSDNTALGGEALESNITGSGNTALGEDVLLNQTAGNDNIAVGHGAGLALTNGDNNIYLGNSGVTTESTTMRLGQAQTRTFIAGIYGVPVSSRQVFINGAGQLGTLPSSARYKRDIHEMRDGSQGLYQLRPVTFRYKQDTQGQQQYGLIAEEVAKVYPELVTKGADGKVESVQYHELIPMLLNEVQHQQQQIAELKAQARQVAEVKAENARLQAVVGQMQQRDEEQRAQHAALAARLERLEAGMDRVATTAAR